MLSKVKGIFFETDDTATTPAAQKAAAPTPQAVVAPNQVQPSVATKTEDCKFTEILEDSLKEKALSTYDYLKFMQSQKELALDIDDESKRFRTAFISVKPLGVTKAKLTESAQHYLSVLDEERKTFFSSVEKQFKDNVEVPETKLQGLQAQIEQKKAEIAALETQLSELVGSTNQWKTKLETSKFSFDKAFSSFKARIESDITKINSYLN
jgi:hypothetical protein